MSDVTTVRQQRVDELIASADEYVIVARALDALAHIVSDLELPVRAYGPTWARVESRLRSDAREARQRSSRERERAGDVRVAIEARERYETRSAR